jgi:hypothetical protein
MKTKKYSRTRVLVLLAALTVGVVSCNLPAPDKKQAVVRTKHNYIILLDLSDRLIVQENQPERDKQIIRNLYTAFEEKVRKDLYIKSRDEFKVVIAPQRGSDLRRDVFEDRLYVNVDNINNVYRKVKEEERRENFFANLDTLYRDAVFSQVPEEYHGADIWKYFYEDLRVDYSNDPDTENFLFILTDGYPIVGKDRNKLLEVKNEFPDLKVILVEAAPRERDMEWDRIMAVWEEWFEKIGIQEYTLIKRGSITKEIEQVKDVVMMRPSIASK